MLSIIFYLYSALIVIVFFLLSVVALVVCAPFDRSHRVVHELSRALCMCFWYAPLSWRRRIEGLENVRRGERYVIVLNHNSMADIISLYFVPLNFRWVSKREVFRIPFIGGFLLLHGDIAIERGRGAESMHKVINDGKKWLSRGASVAMFPEGTRSKDGEIHRFKQGAFALAKEAGVAILPVVLDGTTSVLKKNKLFNWHNCLTIRVLPPIPAEEVERAEMNDLIASVQSQMCDALAQIRNTNAKNE